MKKSKIYPKVVRDDIKEYFDYNWNQKLSDEDINSMSKEEVLSYYLEWNGIIGYTSVIIAIFDE